MTAPGQGQRRIKIVGNRGGDLDKHLLADLLRADGARVDVLADRPAEILPADAIILASRLSSLPNTLQWLKETGRSRRPPVIALVREPLIPGDARPWAMAYAGRLLAPNNPALNRNKVFRRLSRPLYWPIALFGMGKWSGSNTSKDLQFAFTETVLLHTALDEGLIDWVGTSTEEKGQTVANWGYPWILVPYSFDWIPGIEAADTSRRDIDVLFLGRLTTPRRLFALWLTAWRLRRSGLTVKVVTRGMIGTARDAVLDRTKVILHLAKYPWDTPWMRWYMGAARGVAVASEPLSVPSPFIPDVDYLMVPIPALARSIVGLVEDEARRAKMVSNCRERIEQHMTLQLAVGRISKTLSLVRPQGDD
jgi:hypothetical protein